MNSKIVSLQAEKNLREARNRRVQMEPSERVRELEELVEKLALHVDELERRVETQYKFIRKTNRLLRQLVGEEQRPSVSGTSEN